MHQLRGNVWRGSSRTKQKIKKKNRNQRGGNADWSAFISDIKALSELLILLVAAMRYLSCPPVRRMPLSNPTCPLTFSSCQCRCRWPRSCMRQLYGPCAVRRQFGSRSHGQKRQLSEKRAQIQGEGVWAGCWGARTSDPATEDARLWPFWCRSGAAPRRWSIRSQSIGSIMQPRTAFSFSIWSGDRSTEVDTKGGSMGLTKLTKGNFALSYSKATAVKRALTKISFS